MKRDARAKAWQLFLPWAALTLAGFGWFGSQQLGSNLTVISCRSSGLIPVLLIGIVALLLALAGGLLSRRAWTESGDDSGRSFVALIGMMAAGLLGLAIVFQTLAAFIIPRCFG